jgi:hypothetical protein
MTKKSRTKRIMLKGSDVANMIDAVWGSRRSGVGRYVRRCEGPSLGCSLIPGMGSSSL